MTSGAHPAEGMHVKDDRVIISAGQRKATSLSQEIPLCSLEVIANARWTLVYSWYSCVSGDFRKGD